MVPAQVMVFLSQKPGTANRSLRVAVLILAWLRAMGGRQRARACGWPTVGDALRERVGPVVGLREGELGRGVHVVDADVGGVAGRARVPFAPCRLPTFISAPRHRMTPFS